MLLKAPLDVESIGIDNLAIEKLNRFAKGHQRKELEIGEVRKLLSQFRLDRKKIDTVLFCLEGSGKIKIKRKVKKIELSGSFRH